MKDELKSQIESTVNNLIKAIDPYAEYVLKVDLKEDNSISILIEGELMGKFIGYHGKNLYSLETILLLILESLTDRDDRIEVFFDINEYKKKRFKQLRELAKRVSSRVIRENNPVSLSPMNNAERKVVHLEVANIEGVISESIGEGRERLIVISPVSSSA